MLALDADRVGFARVRQGPIKPAAVQSYLTKVTILQKTVLLSRQFVSLVMGLVLI